MARLSSLFIRYPDKSVKRTIADVRCVDAQGRVFIVEMQINWTDSFKQRLLLGTSQVYVKQLETGEEYHLLQPVYGLGLINTIFDKQSPQWYHHYQLVNVEKPVKEVIEGLQLVFIELPKIEAHGAADDIRLLWLRFLREINQKTREVPPELLAVPAIQEAIGLAEEAAYTPQEMRAYEMYWDAVSTEKTIRYDAFFEGKAEGIDKTLQAIKLLKSGCPIQEITEKTGIAYEVLDQLHTSLK